MVALWQIYVQVISRHERWRWSRPRMLMTKLVIGPKVWTIKLTEMLVHKLRRSLWSSSACATGPWGLTTIMHAIGTIACTEKVVQLTEIINTSRQLYCSSTSFKHTGLILLYSQLTSRKTCMCCIEEIKIYWEFYITWFYSSIAHFKLILYVFL